MSSNLTASAKIPQKIPKSQLLTGFFRFYGSSIAPCAKKGFFFLNATGAPHYLNPELSRYAPRLADAINAWMAVIQGSSKRVEDAIRK